MAGNQNENAVQFSAPVGLIFVFNLIIGTGALAMPKAFQEAGFVLGLLTTAILAFVSYMAFTFVVESMSIANAVLASKKAQKLKELAVEAFDAADGNSETELPDRRNTTKNCPVTVKTEYFEIHQRVELGKMAAMFLGKWGVYVFYTFLIVYLYGDLAIYSTVVPKSLMNVVCTYKGGESDNSTCLAYNLSSSMPCWSAYRMTRMNVYRILVVAFTVIVGPFVFLNVSKTKYLQVFTSVSRWTAFLLMIGLASKRIGDGNGDGHPALFDINKFSNLFGISVYAFMCHHSLPSVITPMKTKNGLYPLMFFIYVIILSFYSTLSLTGAFAFARLEDVYTLNFLSQCNAIGFDFLTLIQYFLALFPVFTLSTNFPIVGITLRNNFLALISLVVPERKTVLVQSDDNEDGGKENEEDDLRTPMITSAPAVSKTRRLLERYAVPVFVVVPPIVVSLCTDNVEFLASVTGSYAGVGVQYVIPALLVFGARRNFLNVIELMPRTYASPFARQMWVYLLFVWAVLSVVVVTINHILSGF